MSSVSDESPVDAVIIDPKPEDILDAVTAGKILDAAPKSAVAKFDPLKAGLAQLEATFAGYTPDLSTKEGEKTARAHRKTLVTLRTSADAVYDQLNAPLLDAQRQARALRDEIKKKAEGYEKPIDDAIKAHEKAEEERRAAKAAAEAERVAAIRKRITSIASVPVAAVSLTSEQINAVITDLGNLDLSTERFGEFLDEATVLVGEVAGKLATMRDAAAAREAEAQRLAEERAELERQRVAQAEREAEAERARKAEAERVAAELQAQQAALEAQRQAFAAEQEQARLARERDEAAANTKRQAEEAERQEERRKQQDAFDEEKRLEEKRAQDARDALAAERAELEAREAAIAAASPPAQPEPRVVEEPVDDGQVGIDMEPQPVVHEAQAFLRPADPPVAQAAATAPAAAPAPSAWADDVGDYLILQAVANMLKLSMVDALARIKALDLDALAVAIAADEEVPA